MSLFRSNFPASGDFAPLFRLLDDYDQHRSGHQSALRTFSPRFDVRESSDVYCLDGELPGITQNDIEIEFSDPQTLIVKGRTQRSYHAEPQAQAGEGDNSGAVVKSDNTDSTNKTSKLTYWASERIFGEFRRTFSFAQPVDQDAVKASLKNGILSVTVPKAASTATKKITIE